MHAPSLGQRLHLPVVTRAPSSCLDHAAVSPQAPARSSISARIQLIANEQMKPLQGNSTGSGVLNIPLFTLDARGRVCARPPGHPGTSVANEEQTS